MHDTEHLTRVLQVITKALVELKMQSDRSVQKMNVNLEAHIVGLKLWVRRKIEAQSRQLTNCRLLCGCWLAAFLEGLSGAFVYMCVCVG